MYQFGGFVLFFFSALVAASTRCLSLSTHLNSLHFIASALYLYSFSICFFFFFRECYSSANTSAFSVRVFARSHSKWIEYIFKSFLMRTYILPNCHHGTWREFLLFFFFLRTMKSSSMHWIPLLCKRLNYNIMHFQYASSSSAARVCCVSTVQCKCVLHSKRWPTTTNFSIVIRAIEATMDKQKANDAYGHTPVEHIIIIILTPSSCSIR